MAVLVVGRVALATALVGLGCGGSVTGGLGEETSGRSAAPGGARAGSGGGPENARGALGGSNAVTTPGSAGLAVAAGGTNPTASAASGGSGFGRGRVPEVNPLDVIERPLSGGASAGGATSAGGAGQGGRNLGNAGDGGAHRGGTRGVAPPVDGPGYSVVFPGEGANDTLFAAALDANGRLVVGGLADGTVTLRGQAHAGAVLIWLSPSGEVLQSKSFGSASYDTQVNGIAPLADGSIIAVGTYRSDVVVRGETWRPTDASTGPDLFVMKLDAQGEVLWGRHFGGTRYDWAESVALAPNGDVYVSGYVASPIDFGGGVLETGSESPFLLTLSAEGGYLDAKVFAASPSATASAVGVGHDGSVWLTGYITGSTDFGGGALERAESFGAFLAAFSTNRQHVVSRQFGDASTTLANDLDVVSGGGAVITGHLTGSADFGQGPLTSDSTDASKLFAARFDASGAPVWSSLMDGELAYSYYARASALARDGSLFIAGGSHAWGASEQPMLTHFDADGIPFEPEVFAGSGRFHAIATADEHSVYLAGQLDQGPSDFGFGRVEGGRDFLVVRLAR